MEHLDRKYTYQPKLSLTVVLLGNEKLVWWTILHIRGWKSSMCYWMQKQIEPFHFHPQVFLLFVGHFLF